MKRLALVFGLSVLAAPVQADMTHKIQSSIQLTVDGAGSVATRIPSSMAVSGNNVTLDTAPVLGTLSSGTALGYTPGAYSICLLYTSPSPRDATLSRMPSSA